MLRNICLASSFLLILSWVLAAPVPAANPAPVDDLPIVGITTPAPEPVRKQLDDLFYQWQSFELDLQRLERLARDAGTFDLHVGAEVFSLRLVLNDLRAEGFREEWMTDDGPIRNVVSPVGTFKGQLADQPDSEVRLLILPDLFQGYIRTEDRWIFFDPLTQFDHKAPGHQVVMYEQDDVKPGRTVLCGAARLESTVGTLDLSTMGLPDQGLDTASTGNVYEADLATEADWEYYNRFGGSTASQIQGIVNQVDGIFDDDLGLKLNITFQSVWSTSSDPYSHTDPEDLLVQFKNYWNSNRSGVTRDLAHLFTDKNLDGSVVGIAYVGVVCSDPGWAYGVSEDVGSLMVKLVAHEIGHNFGANHDTSGCFGSGPIMCPSLQSSGPESFSTASENDVDNHLSGNTSCLRFIQRTPSACFSITDNGFYYSFDASCSSDPNGSIVSYHWDFDDGSTGSGQTINHSFSQGTYFVRLTVTDNDGETGLRSSLINNCLVYGGTDTFCLPED